MTRLPAGISGKRAPAAATTVKGTQFGENRVLQPTFFKRGVQATHLSFSILQRAQSPETTGVAGRCEQGWVQMQPTLLSPACNCMPRKPARNAAPNCAPPRYTRKDTQRPEKPHTGRSVGLWVGIPVWDQIAPKWSNPSMTRSASSSMTPRSQASWYTVYRSRVSLQ